MSTEQSQIDNLSLLHKKLEKQKQIKHKIIRRKEIINIRPEIKEIEIKSNQNVTKVWFFKKHTIDKLSARLRKRERMQMNKIR